MINGKPVAGKSYPLTRAGFICAVSRKESSSDLSQSLTASINTDAAKIRNDLGYLGLFQFGEAALIDLGYYVHWDNNSDKTKKNDWTGKWSGKKNIKTLSDFLNSSSKQIEIIGEWINLLCNRLRNRGFNEFYGKIINGIEITESGAIAGAHLVGEGGLGSFFGVSGFKGKYKETDGNNVHISKYIQLFNYYDLENCCNRKIYIVLKNQIGQNLKNKKVVIESEYKGKFKQDKFIINAESDEHGQLPVIVRHPDSKVLIKADGKQSKIISQEADKKQQIELTITEDIKIEAVLEKPSEPKQKEEVLVIEQDSFKNKSNSQEEKKIIKFDIAIIESDTKKKITNMKFFLRYKGEIKQYISDNMGVKIGILAEDGENIDILVNSTKGYQKIKSIIVSRSLENTCVSVSLNIVSVRLKIKDNKNRILKNNKFYVNYRGREIEKITDNNGIIQLKMLNAFVYKLFLKNKTPVLTLRNDPSISLVNVILDDKATKSQNIASTNNESNENIKKDQTQEVGEGVLNLLVDYITDIGDRLNTHTEKNGNPLTKQYGSDVVFTVKTINKSTGKDENLPYIIKYNGAQKSHYSGQDGNGLKKHKGIEGKIIEIIVNTNNKDEVIYTATLKNPMPLIELRLENPKDDGEYLFPLKDRTNSYKSGMARFGSNRSNKTRKHAGCDLYAPSGTEVRAMADGVVRNVYFFYDNTDAIEITHAKHIIRYGEVKKGGSLVKAGDRVKKGQVIGYVGKLTTKGIPSMMLHLEMYSNPSNTGTLTGSSVFKRRSDLVDPTLFLDKASI